MKSESGIKTIAFRVNEKELASRQVLAQDALGGREVYAEPGLSVFQLQDGRFIELYGPGSSYPDYLFEKSEVVISFCVSDLEEALKLLTSAGMEALCGIQHLGSSAAYCYLRDKKGLVFGLTSQSTN